MNRYDDLEKRIAVTFKDRTLLNTVFIHKSYLNEYRGQALEHNERLEFLGDAVLELVVTEYLYKTYPDKPEGDLTNWRSALVKGQNLAGIAQELKLGNYLYLSRGEERSGGRAKNYLLANTMEALIGAMFLDRGYRVSRKFILEFIMKYLDEILSKNLHIDAKSNFQELAQEKLSITPEYKLLKEEGPDHAKIFTMGAYLGEDLVGQGDGSSKQSAEQVAAEHSLQKLGWGAGKSE